MRGGARDCVINADVRVPSSVERVKFLKQRTANYAITRLTPGLVLLYPV